MQLVQRFTSAVRPSGSTCRSKPPCGGAAPSPSSAWSECVLPTWPLGWLTPASKVGFPPVVDASFQTAKARTAAIIEVSALLAFANAETVTRFAPSAEGHATGCRSLMQDGADPDVNQHEGLSRLMHSRDRGPTIDVPHAFQLITGDRGRFAEKGNKAIEAVECEWFRREWRDYLLSGFSPICWGLSSWGYQLLKGLLGLCFGAKHDKRCGLRIFARVMVFKLKRQGLLKLPEAVPAIAAKLRPCPAGDLDAISPLPTRLCHVIGPAGRIDCATVKGAVLHDKLLAEKRRDLARDGRELWRAPDFCRADAMQAHVELGERLFWVN